MKKLYSSLICFLFIAVSQSYGFNWVQKANFTPGLRAGAFAFSIGNKGYVGSGIAQTGTSTLTYVNDFWEYDPTNDTWTQLANLPNAVSSPAAFAINGKGYITTGYTGSTYLIQTLEYDPLTNLWGVKASFPGTARYTTSHFVIGNFAYVGLGKGGPYYSDFYRFDPVADSWTSIASFPASARQSARSFTVGNFGYVIGGANTGGSDYYENWQYDPVNDSWVQKASYPGMGSYGGIAFSFNGLGYHGCGSTFNTNITTNDLFSYDPVTDLWTTEPSFPGGVRNSMSCMVIGNAVYAGLGSTGIFPVTDYQNDWWSFGTTVGLQDASNSNEITVVATNNTLHLILQSALKQNGILEVYDAQGKIVLQEAVQKGTVDYKTILQNQTKGIYFYKIYQGKSLIKSAKFALL